MAEQITVADGEVPISVAEEVQLDDAIRRAANEAQVRGRLGVIIIEAPNKNPMTMVAGSSETVLSFLIQRTETRRTTPAKESRTKMNP